MVLDFGVCKMDTVDTEHLTGTGEAIGTVAYMAPEQIRGASKVDDRADLYAFGVLVFEMVCGRLPHDGPTQMAILASKLEREPARLRDASGVPTPEGLDALVARALVRDPSARFTSAQELLKAWRALGAADRPSSPGAITAADLEYAPDPDDAPTTVGAGPRGPDGGVPVEAHPTNTALTAGISLRKGGSGRIALLLAAGALVAGVISVGAFFARGPDAVGARGAALSAGPRLDPAGAPPGSSEPASAGSGAIGPSGEPVPSSPSAAANPGSLSPSAASTEAPSDPPPSTLASAAPIELDGMPPASAATQAPAAKGDPKRAAPRGRPPRPPAAPRSSGPHITSAPRY
jgi:serine/threonine-protein kinase